MSESSISARHGHRAPLPSHHHDAAVVEESALRELCLACTILMILGSSRAIWYDPPASFQRHRSSPARKTSSSWHLLANGWRCVVGDNMSLTVESAASSTIGPCFGLALMDGGSMACYLDRQKLQQRQSALDGRPSPKRSGTASWASSARPALKRSFIAWPEATAMR